MDTYEGGKKILPFREVPDAMVPTLESAKESLREKMPEIDAKMKSLNLWKNKFPNENEVTDNGVQPRRIESVQMIGFREAIEKAIGFGADIQTVYKVISDHSESTILQSANVAESLMLTINKFEELYEEIYKNLEEANML